MGENNFSSSQTQAKESLFTNFEDVQVLSCTASYLAWVLSRPNSYWYWKY